MLVTLAGQANAKATLLIGLAYGAIVAVSLFFASQLYAGWLLHLPMPRDLAIFLLFGAIIAYKTYSSVASIVLDEIAHLSSWTASAVGAAVALGAAASFTVDSVSAINVYALAAGPSIILVLLWNAALHPAIVCACIGLMRDERYRCDIAFQDAARVPLPMALRLLAVMRVSGHQVIEPDIREHAAHLL
jgi:hypothetical protein